MSDDAAQDISELTANEGTDSPVVDDVVAPVDGATNATVDGSTDAAAGGVSSDDSWRQYYESLGFQNVESPEQAQARMAEAFRQQQAQLQEYTQRLRYMEAIEQRLASVTPPNQPQPATPTQDPNDLFSKFTTDWPEIDDKVLAPYVKRNADGSVDWADHAPPELRKKVDDLRIKQAQWQEVISDPRRLEQAINTRVERLLAERLDGELTQRTRAQIEAQEEQQFFAENTWIYENDPITGQPSGRLSRDGSRFRDFLLEAKEDLGIENRRAQLRYAHARITAERNQAAAAPAQQRANVQPVIANQRQQMLGRTNPANNRPGRNTTAGISDAPANQPTGATRRSVGQMLVGELVEEGYQV